MDVVRVFNNELSSLYEVKPPISKAKMTQITKCAIKGIKFYKHIVQSVEKFIQKCRPEYKVPGLYVVDSIVRQSRHQFGEKDVFAGRFTKNITLTFMNLFKCAEEDRPKIVRVLNLWQKNNVFPSDVIQPLLDMANPNSAGEWGLDAQVVEDASSRKASSQPAVEPPVQNSKSKSIDPSWKGWTQNAEEPAEESHNYSEMTAKNLEKFAKANYASSAVPDPVQAPPPKATPHKSAEAIAEENTVKFNKKLLDFDYGDEEDEEEAKTDDGQSANAPNELAISMAHNLLSNPELLRQLQQMQQTIQQSEVLKSELAMQPQVTTPQKEHKPRYSPEPPEAEPMEVNAVPYHEPHPANIMPFPPYDNPVPYPPPQQPPIPMPEPKIPMDIGYPLPILPHDEIMVAPSHADEDERMIYSMPGEPPLPPQDLDERAIAIQQSMDERIRKDRSRSRSGSRNRARLARHRSRSRSPRRRKSRSRSRSRSRRNRSRSRHRERQRAKERSQERERERRRKGLPQIKKNHISVCSTTLWLGHVPKTLSEIDISSAFGEFGQILSIDMIPPRGCAYVVMRQRQDAHRALKNLKNLKLQGCAIKMAWAPGKGVKGKEFKEYWEADSGVSYVPFDKVSSNDLQVLELLEEGGFIDEDSLPQNLKDLRKQAQQEQVPMNNKEPPDNLQEAIMPPAQSGPPSMMPNSSVGVPMVIPQIMQPQFGMPLPGLLPPQSMMVQMPVAVPPPSPLMMVQPPAQTLLAGTPLPVGGIPQMPHMSLPHPTLPPSSVSMSNIISNLDMSKDHTVSASTGTAAAGDATPTDEDGTSVSSPGCTTVGQSLSATGPCISSSMGTQASGAQFNAVMTHHGMSRPLLPVLPPVSSAGTPIPFPPPQVGFGFPPPPLRPNQNMPGVIPMPNSFPWLHKTTAPAFGNYNESEMRFTSPVTPANMRPPLISQLPNAHPITSVGNNQVVSDTQHPQPPAKDNEMKPSAPLPKEKSPSAAEGGKQFNNRSNANQPHGEPYGRPGGNSPKSFDKDHDNGSNHQDEMHQADFPRDVDMGMVPRYPGPPDFHGGRGPPRGHWMPGQRFPRNVHPGMPFPHRPPRMDVDYYHHQGPPGPRMHGPRGQQPMWGGNGFPPPRNMDRSSNRRDYYGEPHYQEDDRDKKFHPRDDRNDRNRGRDHREDLDRRNTEDKRSVKQAEPIPAAPKPADVAPKPESKNTPSVKTESPTVKPARKPIKDDLSFDLFRLHSYTNRNRRPSMNANVGRNKNEQTTSKPPSQSEITADKKKEEPDAKKAEPAGTDEAKPEPAVAEKNEDKVEQQSDVMAAESRSRKDRADRKRSRWGRTLSQEREFQQQKINEIEMKFQNFETQHQAAESVDGCPAEAQPPAEVPAALPPTDEVPAALLPTEEASAALPPTEEAPAVLPPTEAAPAAVIESSISDIHMSDSKVDMFAQPDCDLNQNISLDRNDSHTTDAGESNDINSASEPAPGSMLDAAAATQVPLAS